jgi:hypothetical protein
VSASNVGADDSGRKPRPRSKNALFDMMAHIVGHPELSKNAVLVGVMLADGAWWDPGRGVFGVTVKHETLGIKARIKSPTTIRKALKELAAAGILASHENFKQVTRGGAVHQAANTYELRPFDPPKTAGIEVLGGPPRPQGLRTLCPSGIEDPLPTSLPTNGNIFATSSRVVALKGGEPEEEAGKLVSISVEGEALEERDTPSSSATVPPAPKLRKSWVASAVAVWEERFGAGSIPLGRIGRALKPLVEHHGLDAVLAAFRRYLDPAINDSEAKFLSPEGFASKYALWAGTSAQAGPTRPEHMPLKPLTREEQIAEVLARQRESRGAGSGGRAGTPAANGRAIHSCR